MHADAAAWLELTEFADCEPSVLAFRALTALIDAWPADDQAAAVGYADKLLSAWPDDVRLAPWSWCKAASQGAVLPAWPLCRGLQLKSHHLTKGPVNLARLACRASLEHVTALDVPSYSPFQELSFLYHRPETLPALRTLPSNPREGGSSCRRATAAACRSISSISATRPTSIPSTSSSRY